MSGGTGTGDNALGGSGPFGGPGTNGTAQTGGGGGGGGAGGGSGGSGGSGFAGSSAGGAGGAAGAGGTAASTAGSAGGAGATVPSGDNGGGGGGGGGYNGNGAGDDTIANVANLLGGAGGTGGAGQYGGGGGEGGDGAVIIGVTQSTNSGTIAGGQGGAGGFGGPLVDGGGGDGGLGAVFTANGAAFLNNDVVTGGAGGTGDNDAPNGGRGGAGEAFASTFTSTNSLNGSITGGAGGNGSANHSGHAGGAGGSGIAGSNGIINNAGTINGGVAGVSARTAFGGTGTAAAGSGIAGNNLVIGNSGTVSGGEGAGGGYPLSGGTGGIGIASSNLTLTNSGQIVGGAGAASNYVGGNGGDAISGAAMAITNDGTISGGAGGAGVVANYSGQPGNAISFTGYTNTLTFGNTTSGINGNLAISAGAIVQFVQPTNTSLASTITGAGSINKMGAGTLVLSGTSTYSGGSVLSNGTLELATADTIANGVVTSGPVGSGPITFGGLASSPAMLTLDAAAQPVSGSTFGTTLAQFGTGDSLDLRGFTYVPGLTSSGVSGNMLTVTNGASTEGFTLSNGAAAYTTSSDNAGGTLVQAVVCFASGTLIRTTRGEIAVEDLRVNDLATTTSGQSRPIRWIGHRNVDGKACIGNDRLSDATWPVRVRRHAFGFNQPFQDLYLSPSHSVCVDAGGEKLVPIYALINGSTIVRAPVDEVVYWHIELDRHDILFANGLPAKSYYDMADHRAFFRDTLGTPTISGDDACTRGHAGFCRPFHDGGGVVDQLRSRLQARAVEIGFMESSDADVRLVVDGVVLRPERVERGVVSFTFQAKARDVRLSSSIVRPADQGGVDPRSLGIAIYEMNLSAPRQPDTPLDLDAPCFAGFFHTGERDDGKNFRWTRGELSLPVMPTAGETRTLRVSYEPSTTRHWVSPRPW